MLNVCPITLQPPSDPVVTADGHAYDRWAIEQWFALGHDTSPLTNLPLPHLRLISLFEPQPVPVAASSASGAYRRGRALALAARVPPAAAAASLGLAAVSGGFLALSSVVGGAALFGSPMLVMGPLAIVPAGGSAVAASLGCASCGYAMLSTGFACLAAIGIGMCGHALVSPELYLQPAAR